MFTHVIILLQILTSVPENLACEDYKESLQYGNYVITFYERRQFWKTSNLGDILFKNKCSSNFPVQEPRDNDTFLILEWRFPEHLIYDNMKVSNDPLHGCSVTNCRVSRHEREIEDADAVVINLGQGNIPDIKRDPKQRWIFLVDQSPAYINLDFTVIEDVFNWSMTYRSDSDVPIPFGRTIPRRIPILDDVTNEDDLAELVPNWSTKRRDVLVSALISNCGPTSRLKFLEKLQKHISVDFMGSCSKSKRLQSGCPGQRYKDDCRSMDKYLFYLVLEDSLCRQYLSEKIFYFAYSKGAIPIIRGPPKEDCEKLLPPNSYLHVDDYRSLADLYKYIEKISKFNDTLLWYHRWRNYYKVIDEHGYFGVRSNHNCRICEALNFNDGRSKVYDEDELRLFLDRHIVCLSDKQHCYDC